MTMGEFLEINPHLHACDFDAKFRSTYLGQAHLAGTGPAGKTCRECIYWHLWNQGRPAPPRSLRQDEQGARGPVEEGQVQRADAAQGEPAHPAHRQGLPAVRAERQPAARGEVDAMNPYVPHTLRHGARRAQASNAPAGSRQGEQRNRPSDCSPIWFGAIVLGVFALASMVLNALPWALS
jgi:hypothetical protein